MKLFKNHSSKRYTGQLPYLVAISLMAIWLMVIWMLVMPGELQAQYQMAANHTGDTFQSGRGELAMVLLDFAESREIELAYQPELLAGQKSDCERLSDNNEEALRCVLSESGYIARRLQNGVYVIQKPEPAKSLHTGQIVGKVRGYEGGEMLIGAHVLVPGTPYAAVSNTTGRFQIERIPPGLYDVCVSMVGYSPMCFKQVHVIAGQDLQVELMLEESTWPLDEVTVTSEQEKRRIMAMADTLNPLSSQGLHFKQISAGLFMSSSPTTVKGVQFGGLASMARDSLHGLQFSGVFNSAENSSQGAQFGGVFNTINGDFKGSQFSGVMNRLEGDLAGGQFAGTLNLSGNARGFQGAGIANLADGDLRGTQMAGLVNVSGRVRGAQFAGIANQSQVTRGFQGAGMLNVSGSMQGWQISGMINTIMGSEFNGVQIAGLINYTNSYTKSGLQIAGLINVAGEMRKGAQIGIVNYARNNKGLPLGVFSYVRETGLRYDAWVDETGMITTAVRSGNRWFSNYLGFGARAMDGMASEAFMFGLGGEFTFGSRFYGTLDAFHYDLNATSPSEPDELLIKMRWMLGYKITPRLSAFGGPTMNLHLSDQEITALPIPGRLESGTWASKYYNTWIGYSFGIRFSAKP